MHPEQLHFFRSVKAQLPDRFRGVTTLEIGSYDVNGSIREVFDGGAYVGVDLVEGPGVDVVGSGHEVRFETPFDVVLSAECFEHNPYWEETFVNMAGLARPGGLVLFTCASEGRPEHGTSRSAPGDSPGTIHAGLDHYRNLVEADFRRLPLDRMFSTCRFFRNRGSQDLYFVGFTPGPESPPAGWAPRSDALARDCERAERVSLGIAAAVTSLEDGRPEPALEQITRAAAEAPPDLEESAQRRLARILHRLGRDAEAEGAARRALALRRRPGTLLQMAMILEALGRPDEALPPASEAVAAEPDNAAPLLVQARLLRKAGRLGEAETALRRAADADPASGAACLQLANLLAQQARMPEALEAARAAVAAAPDDPRFRGRLAELEGRM